MQNNTYVSIWNFVVFVTDETLDIHREWENFINHGIARLEPMTERREIFIDTLADRSMVTLPAADEVVPDHMESYFGWFFMAADESNETVPTLADIHRLKAVLTDRHFNEMSARDKELFATGYKSPVITDAGFDVDTYFRWVSDHKAGTFKQKHFAIAASWLRQMESNAAKRQGFAVHNVFSNAEVDTWHRYSYTSRLSDKLGHELLLVNAGQDSGHILAGIASDSIAKGGIETNAPFTLKDYTVGDDKAPIRVVAIEIPMDDVPITRMGAAVNHGMSRVYPGLHCRQE